MYILLKIHSFKLLSNDISLTFCTTPNLRALKSHYI